MLGEFVAMNKTPDFKLSTQSNQYLDEAIRDEIEHTKKMSTNSLYLPQSHQQPRHFRTTSTNSGYRGSATSKTNGNSLPDNEIMPSVGAVSLYLFLLPHLTSGSSSSVYAVHLPTKSSYSSQTRRRRNSIISESDESYETDEDNKNSVPSTTITVRQINKNNDTVFENQPHRYSTNLKIR
uniref:Uncharacterized protein n=1 Tax=Ditylenchus dipsaci TaxID=166011 RepID=A0A915DIQ2_9BILA